MNTRTKTYQAVASKFGVVEQADWSRVSAAAVLSVKGVGKSFLDNLRKWLAYACISLHGDNPPEYWLELDRLRIETGEDLAACPFTIVIDSNETLPFTFESIYSGSRRVVIQTTTRAMYRDGLADYSIEGMERAIQIERKSDDFWSSMTERREHFCEEVQRLHNACEFSAVICELPRSEIVIDNHNFGSRARSIMESVSAWRVRYPGVHWIFADGRYDAENECYRLLKNFWWEKCRDRLAALDAKQQLEIWDGSDEEREHFTAVDGSQKRPEGER